MNNRELDVLEILWKQENAMTMTEITNKKKGLTQSTVSAVLRNLLRIKLIEVAGVTHNGKVLTRQYKPTDKSKDAIMDHILNELENCKYIVSLDDLSI